MKKNQLSDKTYGKGSKGFYSALGISAVMIASACFFAYDKGEDLSNEHFKADNSSSTQEESVAREVTGVPRTTAKAYRITTHTVSAHTSTAATTVTVQAAEIIPALPAEPAAETVQQEAAEQTGAEAAEAANSGVTKLENPKPPLADVSNVLNPFSGAELVKNETTGSWQTHNGTDIAAEVGTEVYAVSSGEITAVDNDPLWGVTVTLDHHNGFVTKYCGLGSDLSVQAGNVVVSGDTIGAVGETADIESAVSPHLHIEITHNGAFVDPMSYFT